MIYDSYVPKFKEIDKHTYLRQIDIAREMLLAVKEATKDTPTGSAELDEARRIAIIYEFAQRQARKEMTPAKSRRKKNND